MSKSSSSGLTGFGGGDPHAVWIDRQAQALQTLRKTGECTPGGYPWDFWQLRACERGLSPDLSGLGRAVMREAHQHQWEPFLQWLCGWEDRGEAMIALALVSLEQAARMWRKLLVTDGGRGTWDENTGERIAWL